MKTNHTEVSDVTKKKEGESRDNRGKITGPGREALFETGTENNQEGHSLDGERYMGMG
jgi:hypothetical protein